MATMEFVCDLFLAQSAEILGKNPLPRTVDQKIALINEDTKSSVAYHAIYACFCIRTDPTHLAKLISTKLREPGVQYQLFPASATSRKFFTVFPEPPAYSITNR